MMFALVVVVLLSSFSCWSSSSSCLPLLPLPPLLPPLLLLMPADCCCRYYKSGTDKTFVTAEWYFGVVSPADPAADSRAQVSAPAPPRSTTCLHVLRNLAA